MWIIIDGIIDYFCILYILKTVHYNTLEEKMTCKEFKKGLEDDGIMEQALDKRLTDDIKAKKIIGRFNRHMRECDDCRELGIIWGARFAINPNML